jgi:TetR/AcrR family transcriptional regulator, mexJK operon transcriptional repressor
MPASTAQSETAAAPMHRGEKRRQEIAAVAELVFFEQGYAETTMQAIAARAGASKETLYRHFGSKEDLFAEVVSVRARTFLEDMDARFQRPGSVADVLRSLALKILDTMVGRDAISLCRIVVAECPRYPELGIAFMAAGPDRVRTRLTDFLAEATGRGELSCADPACAARIFLGAVMTSFHLAHLVLPQDPPISRLQIRSHVDEVMATFMGRYAAGARPGATPPAPAEDGGRQA